ncbi:hypothetical protein ACJIZ3_016856 [Penstemon smallii]|uniref:Rho termination factor-like N-terminal domain-containing protein n=1 Tax=Penstemon smallii TaxID=265156 RepID=A0ABD3STZ3_9LAMI
MGISPYPSRCDYKLVSDVKLLSLRCASRHTSSVCNATSSNYRRNPDFPKQNKHSFSRNRNRNQEERDGYEDFEESETFSSKNGPIHSVSGNQKFQATATPGPREKEIVELFRKVQAQLRERSATKEDRKVEDSQEKSKENETVDSLLKLLRKHSVQQGKRNSDSSNNRDFILDQPEQVVVPQSEERSRTISGSSNSVKHEVQEVQSPNLSRPKSNFRKRSPVPEIKFQPVYTEGSVNSISQESLNGTRNRTIAVETHEKVKIESDVEPLFSEGNMFDEILEDESSEIFEIEHEEAAEEKNVAEISILSGMKLTELRALAKSRGMKGFSKLKKNELINLLSVSSV